MENNIKGKAFKGTIWKFLERSAAHIISLVVSIILARLLTPKDYSVVGIIGVFFSFANIIITGGLNTALIQKKDSDVNDYSSVLWVSLAMSIALYFVLFCSAPVLAQIYNIELLSFVVRVSALALPIYAIKAVLCAYVSSNLDFRKFFFATIGGTLFSAIIGIAMALYGFGVWALVAQQLSNALIDTIILAITTKMPIAFKVCFSRFKILFQYGWKVFLSSMLSGVYVQALPLVIGLKFSPVDLSFYTKGKNWPALISSSTTETLSAVLFPVMSKFQDDKEALLRQTRRFIQLASYTSFPAILGLFAISDNFVRVLLTDKWLPASIYIKIFCITNLFDMVHAGNCETIKAMGRSDMFLKMETIKKSLYFIIIACFVFFCNSPVILAFSTILCTLVAIVVNSVPNITLLNYTVKQQLFDLLPNLLISIIMCVIVLLIGKIGINVYIVFFLQIIVGVVSYVLLSLCFKNKNFFYTLDLIKALFKRK